MSDPVSARDAVASAFAEIEKKETSPAPDASPAPVDAEAPEADGAPGGHGDAEPLDGETPAQAAERARDEKGKFVKAGEKPEAKPTTEGQPEKAAAQQPNSLPPPPNWKGDGKIRWNKLPLPIQQELINDYKARQELEGKYSALDSILAPRRQMLAATYGDEANALKQLFALSDYAQKDPAGFLQFFARQRGIDISALTGQRASQVQDGPQAPQDDPRLASVMSELTGLKQQLTHFTQSQQDAQRQEAQRDIDAFFSDPKFPYAQDVRSDMAILIGNGRAKNLEDAYEQAKWLNPSVRERILAEQAQEQQRKQLEIANSAKRAAVSVSGAPGGTGGIPRPTPGVPTGETARDTVRRMFLNGAGA